MSVRRLFKIDPASRVPLRDQLRRQGVESIESGYLKVGDRMPSSRQLGKDLGVSRTTVVAAYDTLVEEGVLSCAPRVGYRVGHEAAKIEADRDHLSHSEDGEEESPESGEPQEKYRYTLEFEVRDAWQFPLSEWRAATWKALGKGSVGEWNRDATLSASDDNLLIEQLCGSLLPRRGILQRPENVVMALSAFDAVFLAVWYLARRGGVLGFEDIIWRQMQLVFRDSGMPLQPLRMDDEGIIPDQQLEGCKILVVSPAMQIPTTARMSLDRMKQLLEWADVNDAFIIELDLTGEINFAAQEHLAMKSYDANERVIHVNSFTALLGDGIRGSFLVGPPELVEAIQSHHMQIRGSLSKIVERTLAHFVASGDYHSYSRKMRKVLKDRRDCMLEELERRLPGAVTRIPPSGSSFWLKGPEGSNSTFVSEALADEGIMLRPSAPWFFENPKMNYFRVCYRAIESEDIPFVIQRYSEAVQRSRSAAA